MSNPNFSDTFEDITTSIVQEEQIIEQNRQNRNRNYKKCMQQYLNHLKQETKQLQASQNQNKIHNQRISDTFENTYERLMVSAQVSLRKIKRTWFQKKQFWNKLTNLKQTDQARLVEFYSQKRTAEDCYHQAVEDQNLKKPSYRNLVGKYNKNQGLRHWQANNKLFQEQVNEGTRSMKQWKKMNRGQNTLADYGEQNIEFIGHFTQGSPIKYEDNGHGEQFLKNFQKKMK